MITLKAWIVAMRFAWSEEKNRINQRKHDVAFETALLVFDDPYALTQRDEVHDQEERYLTIGTIGAGSTLFVAHTMVEETESELVVRIISARAATARERTAMKKLTKDQKRQIAVIAAKKDADIDLSDIPEVVNWDGAEMGKFYRPPKKPVTMRLDADVIEWLKGYGPGYQTRANTLLRHAMVNTARIGRKKRTA